MPLHITVLLHEAVDALAIKPGGVYVDGTFGRGGHSRLILSKLNKNGRLLALDKDPAAITAGQEIVDQRFSIKHCDFSQLQQVVKDEQLELVDGMLLDLGVSSPQLEDAERGFSFRSNGPLDMRMDTKHGQTAAEWLAIVSEADLATVIKEYGEERFARQVARAIVVTRQRQPITTTVQLAEVIVMVVRSRQRQREKQHPATRTFQAIRIFINKELEALSAVLSQCVALLKPGGRLVVISFHSLEDRIVKNFMRSAAKCETLPRRLPLREQEVQLLHNQMLRLIGKAVRPSAEEVTANIRARSAVMRVAERI